MDYQTISIIKSVVFFIMFFFPSHIILPKGLQAWKKWKETEKVIHLSNAVGCGMLVIFFYISALIVVIDRILGTS